MANPTPDELDDRKAAILRAIVETYIETAQPVGSSAVVGTSEVTVSSATVRNEMAQLENEGYIIQPHTSAGRIPTERGYRFFVDTLQEEAARLKGAPARRVRDFFDHTHGELELMLHDTSQLLSDITAHTAVVVGLAHDVATVRSVQLVGLAPHTALVVLVLSNGAVEKHTIELPDELTDDQLADASTALSAALLGRSRRQLPTEPADGAPVEITGVVRVAFDALRTPESSEADVFVGGTSNAASSFEAIDTVRNVLELLEQQLVVVSLIRDVMDRGLQVAIGSETRMEPLAEASVVVAPYDVEGQRAGSIAVLGPTRMDYPQALAAVAVVSNSLGKRLSEG
ncbi:MAG: heat-inducible transcription repressor HrcA [Actinomycetia bacterium]|nr:heat-inducible transcription repressor HrcA [Actinomycetes bacterium]